MALIPTKRELGPLAQLAARPQFAPEQDPNPAADANMAKAVTGVGDLISAVAAARQKDERDAQAFATTQGLQQVDIEADAELPNIAQKVPANGFGLQQTALADYDKRSAQLYKDVPAYLQPRVAQVIETRRKEFEAKTGKMEADKRTGYYETGITVSQQRALERVYNDPSSIGQARGDVLADIRVSGLDQATKDTRERETLEAIGKAKFARLSADNPDERLRLGVALLPDGAVASPGDPSLPAGMRNNNPGNIKFVGQGRGQGVIGPSQNTDQGDPQAVFATPEAGMRAAYDLARRKYDAGKTTANELIAGEGGWTPGNKQAAANIAATMGINPDEDLNLQDRNGAARFLRALVKQEHGNASAAYSDDMIVASIDGDTAPASPSQGASGPALPLVRQGGGEANLTGVKPLIVERFSALQNQWGRQLPINSGFRDAVYNKRVGGADKSQHMHGNALDVDVSSLSKEERTQLIGMASAMGFSGIGVYANAIHLDMGNRRAWGPTHHGDSVPSWAKSAIDAHLAGKPDASGPGPLAAPGYDLDPDYASIPFTERLDMANKAQAEARKRREAGVLQEKADYDGRVNSFDLGILKKEITSETQILTAGFRDDDTAKLLRSFRSQQEKVSETDLAVRDYIAGNMTNLNPLDGDQKKRANLAYDGLLEQLATQPEEVQRAQTDQLIRRTQVIPDKVEAGLRMGMAIDPTFSKPDAVAAGMGRAARVRELAPRAFATLPADARKDLAEFEHRTADLGMSGPDAAARMIEMRKPEYRRNDELYAKSADKFVEGLSTDYVAAGFSSTWGATTPGTGADSMEKGRLLIEFRELAREEFIKSGGDPEVAKVRAMEGIRDTWAVSRVSGSPQIMKLPPELKYPQVNGSFDYIREDALATARELNGEAAVGAGTKPQGRAVQKAPSIAIGTLRPFNADEYRDNGDGSYSTEVTTTIQDANGKWVNVPSLWMSDSGYVDLADDEDAIGRAVQNYEAKGKPFPRFDTVDQAEAAAQERSKTGGVANGPLAGSSTMIPGSKVTNIILRADPLTAKDINENRLPSYAMAYEVQIPGEAAPVIHWAPTRWAYPADELKTLTSADQAAKRAQQAQDFQLQDEAITDERAQFNRSRAASDAASAGTVGPDWMKARAREIAGERSRMGLDSPNADIPGRPLARDLQEKQRKRIQGIKDMQASEAQKRLDENTGPFPGVPIMGGMGGAL